MTRRILPTLSSAFFATMLACGGTEGDADSDDTTGAESAGESTGESGESGGASTGSGSGSGSSASAGTSTTGTTSEGGTTGGDEGGELDACGNAPGQLLPPTMPWNTPITDRAVDGESPTIIGYLQDNVRTDVTFQIDLSIVVLEAPPGTTKRSWEPTGDFYEGECDPAPVPLPAGGHIEGEDGYACEGGGDCHLIVIARDECRLYEQWRADFRGDPDQGGCMAIWELDRQYDETLRGDYCTSADAAGLPIAAHLFDADEVAAGEIRHALRFILPNENMRDDIYVRPATHSTPATSGPAEAPPYGARLRLRADFDETMLPDAARVIARALKTYGMVLSDGGNVTFTGAADDFTTAKWDDLGLGTMDLEVLQWDDFEVVDGGRRIVWSDGDCDRVPIDP